MKKVISTMFAVLSALFIFNAVPSQSHGRRQEKGHIKVKRSTMIYL